MRLAVASPAPRFPDDATIARAHLERVGDRLGGVALKAVAVDRATGDRYVFKPTLPGDHRPEVEAWVADMRRAGGAPAVPSRRQRLDGQEGYVKPLIANQGTLTWDPRKWTPSERQAVLQDAPWLDVLGNYDAKSDQYVRTGGTALDIDWDLALSDYLHDHVVRDDAGKMLRVDRPPIDRYKSINPMFPSSQDMLFAAYVHGKVDVDLAKMVETARQAGAIPRDQVLRALEPLSSKLFAGGKAYGPYRNAAELQQAVLQRVAEAPARYQRLAIDLAAERSRLTGQAPSSVRERVRTGARDAFQEGWARYIASPMYGRATHGIQKISQRFGISNFNATVLGA